MLTLRVIKSSNCFLECNVKDALCLRERDSKRERERERQGDKKRNELQTMMLVSENSINYEPNIKTL